MGEILTKPQTTRSVFLYVVQARGLSLRFIKKPCALSSSLG